MSDKWKRSNGRDESGYIYLMYSTGGLYKIGCTNDVPQRLVQLQSGHYPYKLTLVHFFPCESMNFAENELHSRFNSKRVTGEWFSLDEEDVEFITSLETITGYPDLNTLRSGRKGTKLNPVQVYLSDEEYLIVKREAACAELTVSNYIRSKIGLHPLKRGRRPGRVIVNE